MAYGDATTVRHLYLKTAWLAGHLDTEPSSEWAGIHGAIWHLTTGGALLFGGETDPNVQTWVSLAYQSDLTSIDASGWAVVTDVSATSFEGGAQEFLVRTNVVPEPSTYLLLATGLAGIALIARRRRAV